MNNKGNLMNKIINGKQIIATIVFIIVALTSIFIISPKASSTDSYKSTIESLDNKKMTVRNVPRNIMSMGSFNHVKLAIDDKCGGCNVF